MIIYYIKLPGYNFKPSEYVYSNANVRNKSFFKGLAQKLLSLSLSLSLSLLPLSSLLYI